MLSTSKATLFLLSLHLHLTLISTHTCTDFVISSSLIFILLIFLISHTSAIFNFHFGSFFLLLCSYDLHQVRSPLESLFSIESCFCTWRYVTVQYSALSLIVIVSNSVLVVTIMIIMMIIINIVITIIMMIKIIIIIMIKIIIMKKIN